MKIFTILFALLIIALFLPLISCNGLNKKDIETINSQFRKILRKALLSPLDAKYQKQLKKLLKYRYEHNKKI